MASHQLLNVADGNQHQHVLTGVAAGASVSNIKPLLTKAMIEVDDFCMKSNHIAPLLERIWKYSSMEVYPYPTPLELAADHRYWLPNGLLAEEWIFLLALGPTWLLELAPPEVKSAFEQELVSSFGSKPSFAKLIRGQDRLATPGERSSTGQLINLPVPHSSHAPNSRGHTDPIMSYYHTFFATQDVLDVNISISDKSSRSSYEYLQSILADLENGALSGPSTGLLPAPPSAPDPRMLLQRSTPAVGLSAPTFPSPIVVDPQLLSAHNASQARRLPLPFQPTQHAPQGHAQPALASTATLNPGLHPFAQLPVFPLRSVPSGTAAFEQNPAAPPIFHQLLRDKDITTVGYRPGSMPRRGNANTAWSAERIRAFVEIQGESIHHLPPVAFSESGNEMTNFRTPLSIDMRCCPFETSLEEIFTFFSNTCTITVDTCVRALRHWKPMDIARYINYAHDLQSSNGFSRSKTGHRFARARTWLNEHPSHVPTASLRNVSRNNGLNGANADLHDFFLYNMGDGVVRPPIGRGAQMLTRVIDHVRNVSGDRNVLLSEAAAYARQHNITVPAHEQMNFMNLDVEDRLPSAAMLATMKADYRAKHAGEDP